MRIAIVGTGISGLTAAHYLHREHEITVFEADTRVGGHANTVDVTVDGREHAVDTGFIVYNEQNYPGFVALLRDLGIATQPTDMSFGVSDRTTGIEFRATNLNTIFAQRRNVANRPFLRMLTDILRFNRAARALVESSAGDGAPEMTLREFLRRGRYSPDFARQFIVPLGASLWSADPETFTEMPALAYARFMYNHGLLQITRRPQWRTITGGSRNYVQALTAGFSDRIRVATPIRKIVAAPAGGAGVELLTEQGPESFDRVIVATHSDQALRMLADSTPAERAVLGAIRYQRNTTTLHTDERMLAAEPRARASWNYTVRVGAQRATVTYCMNSLQSIESTRPLLVTLNRRDEIDERSVLAEFEYAHPVFDAAAMSAQRRRDEIQGTRGIYFAGAYWGYGFHEDGVQSARAVVRAMGAER